MPLPRPIPTPAHARPAPQHHRPGSSVPRKSAGLPLSSLSSLDWRAEVALLDALPRSLPASAMTSCRGAGVSGGVVIADQVVRRGQAASTNDFMEARRREVDVQELVDSSKGKRGGRVTTAQQLGFDFVPYPSVVPLPDVATPLATLPPRTAISPLSATPITPPLVPALEEPHEDLEDWEHIEDDAELSDDEAAPPAVKRGASQRQSQAVQDEDEVIVLGELELDDPVDLVEVQGGGRKEGISYARAAGSTARS